MSQDASSEMHQGIRVRQSIRQNPIMRLTARHMHGSHTTTAPITAFGEADATNLVRLRKKLAPRSSGRKVTISHLIIKILACALAQRPELNAAFAEDTVKIYDEINIGMATALPDGNLVVPVIKNAHALTIDEIAAEAIELMDRARAGRQRLEDLRGGTFTLTNTGMLPAMRFGTALLNLPQVAILGVGAIYERPVLRNGTLESQQILGLSQTVDHRVLNGYAAASFIQLLADMIVDPIGPLGIDA